MPPIDSLEILIVADDPDTLTNLQEILEPDRHRVTVARTAAEARARAAVDPLDVIVLDRQLADFEILAPELTGLAPRAAVLIVTSKPDLPGATPQLRPGCFDCLLKPLDADGLRGRLTRIASQHRLTREKQRSDVAFRQLLEAAECVILILREGGENLYISPFGEQLTGYDRAAVRGRDCIELLVPPEFREAIHQENVQILAGRPTQGFECPLRCRDGSLRAMIWNARLLPDYEGGPAIMTVGQDISVVKEAQERALQAERLAAIGQMVAGLAHESRNALQRSQACLELLALRVSDRPEALDLIGRIQKAQDDLHHLFEDVRAYAAPIQIAGRPCRLDQLWREAWSQVEPQRREKSARLVESRDGVDLACVADPFRLEQVFRNLFDNALSAGAAPVEIGIRAEEALLNGRPAVRLAFYDNGPGLKPEHRARVFDPFFTTKTHGTGLGLSIAKRIVEAHGGWIRLGGASSPGAHFLITLLRESP